MVLAYIQKMGTNYEGKDEYEFIFCASEDEVIAGEQWDRQHGIDYGITPPGIESIAGVSRLLLDPEDIDLELVQEIDEFTMQDAVEGIIALAWEVDPPVTFRTKRLVLRFGERYDDVKKKLYARDIELTVKIIDENAHT